MQHIFSSLVTDPGVRMQPQPLSKPSVRLAWQDLPAAPSPAEASEPDGKEPAPQAFQNPFAAFFKQQEPPKEEQPAPVPAPGAPAPPAPVSKPQSNPYLNFRSEEAVPAQPEVPMPALKTEPQKQASDQAGPVAPAPQQKPFPFGRSDSRLEADEPAKAAEEPKASIPPPPKPVPAQEQPKNRFSFSAPKPEVPEPEAPKPALPKPGEQQCTVRLAVACQLNSSAKAEGAKLGVRQAASHGLTSVFQGLASGDC